MTAHAPILLLLLPLLAVPLTVVFSWVFPALTRLLVFVAFVVELLLGFHTLNPLLTQGIWHYNLGGWAPPWGIELVLTPFTLFLSGIAWFVGLGASFYGLPFWVLHRGEEKKEGLFYSFLFLSLAAFMGLLLIRDVFSLYLLLEISIAAGAALLVVGQVKGWLDGFYFFLYGSTGASFFLLGAFFLYAFTGTLHLDDLLAQIFIAKNGAIVITAGSCIALALLYPLSFPTPWGSGRILGRTPAFILGFLSSVWVRGLVYLSFVLIFFVLNLPGFIQPLWMTVGEYGFVLFLLLQFILAVRQKDMHHALGFLSLAQLGYLFAGFILGNKSALTGTLMELVSQVLVMAGLFFAAGTLRSNPGTLPFSRLAGLARHRPLVGLSLVIFTASIAGIPPTGGSFGKWYLIQGALEKKDWALLGVLLVCVLFSFFYFAKWTVFLYEHRSASSSLAPASRASQWPVFLLAVVVLLLGIFHQEIIHNFIEPALPKAFQNIPMLNVPFLGKQVE